MILPGREVSDLWCMDVNHEITGKWECRDKARAQLKAMAAETA